MYRFLLRPKWILFHVVVVVAAVGMLGLARWQWNRHLERDAFVSTVHEREDADARELLPLLSTESAAEIEYFTVSARGSFVQGEQFLEINQTVDGVNGMNVLAPFQIDGGPIIIVNRGFIALDAATPPAPEGDLVIGGMARTTEQHQTGQLTDNNDGATNQVRLIDLPALAKRLQVDLAPVYIDFQAADPPLAPPPAPVAAPDLSGGPPHVSYTIQWCIFSICVVAGWVFAVRRSVRTRRRAAEKAAGATPLPPTDAAAAETDGGDLISAERPGPPSA